MAKHPQAASRGILAAALLLSALLPGCGRAEQPLRVTYQPHLSFAPLMIARREGYFREAGLQVEYVSLKRSAHGIAALVKGDLDVVSGFLSVGLLNAIGENGGIKIVACKGYAAPGRRSYNSMVGRRGIGPLSELTAEKLRGCRVLTGRDTFQALLTERFLGRWGLRMDDVRAFRVPPPAQLSALAEGNADLAATTEPWATRILDSGHGELLAQASDVMPGFQYGYVAFGPSLLERDRQAGRRFMVAYVRALRRLEEGKTADNLEALAAETGLDRDLLQRVGWSCCHLNGHINVESVVEFQDWAVQRNLLERRLRPREFWEPAFARYADDRLRNRGSFAGGR